MGKGADEGTEGGEEADLLRRKFSKHTSPGRSHKKDKLEQGWVSC